MPEQTTSRYRIIRRLGEGGMGEVFLAEDVQLERTVALKVMSAELAKDDNQRKRFRTEAKAVSGLNHPHICVVYEVGENEEGRPFLAMEYIEGQTLEAALQQRRLRIREVISLGIEVAEALAAAHERHIIHRDIKPGNLMLDRSGRTKILDFGLAKRLATDQLGPSTTSLAQTKTGFLIGTPSYMSPEQVLGRELDNRSDIFSLGVVLYELLAGQKPFIGKTVGETINNIVNQQPEPLGLDNPLFSPALDNIISKCLEKDPANRYASAREVAADLIELRTLAERTTETNKRTAQIAFDQRNGEPAKSSPSRASRRPLILAGVGLAVLLLAIGAVLIHTNRSARSASGQMAAHAALQKSVAVLPFDNFSGEPNTDYLSDGLTEEITTALSRIHGLKVAARNSAFTFKGRKEDVRKIGAALKVETLLEGSIRKVGNRIRVTAQLINVADGFHLWSNTFDRPVDDIIALQADIAGSIAERLQGHATAVAEQAARKSADPDAHRLYLQGRLFWNKRTEVTIRKAIDLFKQAIAKDDSYSDAHAALAASYVILPGYSVSVKKNEYYALGRASANRALELDPGCAEAHAVLGNLQADAHDLKGAEEHFRRAIQLSPNYATAHHWYSRFLGMHGRVDEAFKEIQTAVDLDPLSPIIRTLIPECSMLRGDLDRAQAEGNALVQAFPDFPAARKILVMTQLLKGQFREALAEIDRTRALQPEDPLAELQLRAYALSGLGQTNEARKILALLNEQRDSGKLLDHAIAFVFLGLGEKDQAIETLERLQASEGLDEEILIDPFYKQLRQVPRFEALLKKAGLGGQVNG